MILVDYRCTTCSGRVERLVATPPPSVMPCPACGAPARRCYRPVSLGGVARPPAADGSGDRAPSCREYPDVPGLCHLTPPAARAWVARARRDNRRLERELQRQEQTLREHGAAAGEPVRHDHGHGRPPHPGHPHAHPAHRPPGQGRDD
ncbi:MAG: zinc ribbon domain-containing protein [Mycobacterium sp.]|uniref:zinc ribbon domain-containing protein n=1 Tax=Mycobacterium sp. TaxID=1785 RepID=UPI0026272C2A|nr:zinc ribbon domain-containing protein [Mycobacterium sp.]MDI3314812.1 zinc ribbon domain-containing protein [Mycobacterium sp.]